MGFIDAAQLERVADAMGDNNYRRYLLALIDEKPGPATDPA
jgi:hypothetical protein